MDINLKKQFQDYEDEITYLVDSIKKSQHYSIKRFSPLFFPSCYRLLVIVCADFIDPILEEFIGKKTNKDLDAKIKTKMKSMGHEEEFILSLTNYYLGLRELRNFITHRGLKNFQSREKYIRKAGLKVNTKEADLNDINHVLKIFYASQIIFNSNEKVSFSLSPLNPPYFTKVSADHVIYDEKHFRGMIYQNLEVLLEHSAEMDNEERANLVINNWERHSSEFWRLVNSNLDEFHIERIINKCSLQNFLEKDDSKAMEIFKGFVESLEDEQRNKLFELKKSIQVLVKNISWVKRIDELASCLELNNLELKNKLISTAKEIEKSFYLDRLLYYLY